MPEKKSHQAGNQVASTGLSTNGNGAHPQFTTVLEPGSQAIWRNADHDQPVVIVGMLGEQDGVRYYAIEGSSTGIPEHELVALSGAGAASLLGELQGLLEQAKVEPADVLSAKKVAAVLPTVASYQGIALQAALDALRALIGYLPADEREALYPAFVEHKLFAKHDDWIKFLTTCTAPPGSPVFNPLSLADLLAMPPKVYLIDQLLAPGDIGTLYGPPGSGKTFVIIDLIVCACLGKQWAMRFDVLKPMQVAYCAGEGASGLPARFAAAAEHYGVRQLPGFTFFATAPQLFDTSSAESVQRFVSEWRERQAAGAAKPLDLLIIDTMHSATVGADENSSQDMGLAIDAAKQAIKALGCAVLLVHHTNKAGTSARGSSSINGAMDVMIEIKGVASKYAMCCEKLKDGQKWKEQTFDLVAVSSADSVRVWWDEPGGELPNSKGKQADKLLAELQSRPGKKFTAKQLAEAVGATQNTVANALARLVEKGSIKRSLKYEDAEPSSRNPWVFYLDPTS